MESAIVPSNEVDRLKNLQSYQILDTKVDREFDTITEFAAQYFEVPTALISLVDKERQWFKSHYGTDACETSRDIAFCAHAILADEALIVPDALQDCRFADNPLVSGEPFVRFYTGMPLKTREGYNIGTLCLIDTKPREIGADQIKRLERLARMVVSRLELRLARIKLNETYQNYRGITRSA